MCSQKKINKISVSANNDKSDSMSIRLCIGKICGTELTNILIYCDNISGENTQERNLYGP